MATPTAGALRLARALVVAGVVVGLAAGAHLIAGGALPAGIVTAALGALVLAASVALTGRRLGVPTSVVLLGAGQLVLHGAFSVFQGAGCTSLAATGHEAHLAGAAHAATSGCAPDVTHAMALPMLGTVSMVAAHGIAVLACALVIAGTDRALMWLVAWLGPRLIPTGVTRLPAWAELPVPVDRVSFERQTWRGVVPLRGPPAWQPPVPPAL